MWGSSRNSSQSQSKRLQKQDGEWVGVSFRPENFIPGIVIGFILGMVLDMWTPPSINPTNNTANKKNFPRGKGQRLSVSSNDSDQELKMVLIVRQDLKMRPGKIASQCAHAATGMYAELVQSNRTLLRKWEQCGQPKIVVTCKNQGEMNNLKEAAEEIGLPTFVVADAGRTQVLAGSKTVLAVGPGPKAIVDSVAGKLNLL